MDFELPVRPAAAVVPHRLQRHRRQAGQQLLRFARLRSADRQPGSIARNEVPPTHWLHLGRPLTRVDGTRALLSWGGTMFEYLMPALIMPAMTGIRCMQLSGRGGWSNRLWQAQGRAVGHLRSRATMPSIPNMNYQYRTFGVPGLGFKRNVAEDLVITPYASLLALPFQPQAVAENLTRLTQLGALGVYGLYEAVDFTPARLLARPGTRARARVYGASPGHDPGGAGQLPVGGSAGAGPGDGTTFPL